MSIFVDQDGHNIKFFIQKGLLEADHATLVKAIEDEGGKVEAKVPIKGYVLVQHGTPEGDRLYDCWAKTERPERHFVPLTWVDACKEAGTILRQIFVQNGEPVRMCIHPSIANLNSRDIIAKRILHSGGDPTASEQDAHVILADRDTVVFEQLQKMYRGHDKHIESHLWVKKCIDRGVYAPSPTTSKNPGGRRAGDERTSFSDADEANLCEWIATVIPYKESGGRTGNKIYQELVSRVNDPAFPWVARHTWQSWRERYKKNASRLDVHIAAIVARQQQGGGAPYAGYIRQPDVKVVRRRSRKKQTASGGDMTGETHSMGVMSGVGNGPAIVGGSRDESESDWSIRVGDGPPPTWAKRKLEDNAAVINQALKRIKTSDSAMGRPAVQEQIIHPVDQALEDIANEFQFLISEVRAFYDRTGDMNATRDRFAQMRHILNALP